MYEVFLCSNPAPIPINFAVHTWFVINENGVFSRYEILSRKNTIKPKYHLHIGHEKCFEGLGIFPRIKKPVWKSNIIGCISGPQAKRIIEEIKASETKYPHTSTYRLTGPNSNTYTQWVLNKFPEWDIKLPWNAFGK